MTATRSSRLLRTTARLRTDIFIARLSRERVGWDGKQRETLRDENPVRTSVPGVCPGQRVGFPRAHNPKVALLSRSVRSRCFLPGGKTPLSVGGDSTGWVQGSRCKSCPRYEEIPWDTYILKGFLIPDITACGPTQSGAPMTDAELCVLFRFMMVIVVPVGVFQVRDAVPAVERRCSDFYPSVVITADRKIASWWSLSTRCLRWLRRTRPVTTPAATTETILTSNTTSASPASLNCPSARASPA